ncbi:hypothetical protein AHAS_Ahas13G0234100 [Arachis hypogaea]
MQKLYQPLVTLIHESESGYYLSKLLLENLYDELGQIVKSLCNRMPLSARGPLWLFQLWLIAVFEKFMSIDGAPLATKQRIEGIRLAALKPAFSGPKIALRDSLRASPSRRLQKDFVKLVVEVFYGNESPIADLTLGVESIRGGLKLLVGEYQREKVAIIAHMFLVLVAPLLFPVLTALPSASPCRLYAPLFFSFLF